MTITLVEMDFLDLKKKILSAQQFQQLSERQIGDYKATKLLQYIFILYQGLK